MVGNANVSHNTGTFAIRYRAILQRMYTNARKQRFRRQIVIAHLGVQTLPRPFEELLNPAIFGVLESFGESKHLLSDPVLILDKVSPCIVHEVTSHKLDKSRLAMMRSATSLGSPGINVGPGRMGSAMLSDREEKLRVLRLAGAAYMPWICYNQLLRLPGVSARGHM